MWNSNEQHFIHLEPTSLENSDLEQQPKQKMKARDTGSRCKPRNQIGDCHTVEGSLDYLLRWCVVKRGTTNFFCCYPEDLYKILYSGLYKDGNSKRFHHSNGTRNCQISHSHTISQQKDFSVSLLR